MKESIQVAIRVRPPSHLETANGDPVAVTTTPTEIKLETEEGKPNLSCAYSRVLDMDSTQDDVFDTVRKAIGGVSDGINGCVFSYGQTGAGKVRLE